MRSRIDLLSDNFDQNLFDAGPAQSKTYEDLIEIVKNEEHRPYLVINATDMSTGTLFPFIQLQFDLLCSDLNQVKIADAVAASAAYPVFLSARTLTNYRSDDSCLDQAAEQERRLRAELDARRTFVTDLRKELNDAETRMGDQQEALNQAEGDVRQREVQVQRADERVEVGLAELRQAEEQIREIQEAIAEANREVLRLAGELDHARRQEVVSLDERSNALRIEWQKQEARDAEAGEVMEEIRELTERLKNVQGDAEREGTIKRITDWLVNALGQSDTETGTGERTPQDVGDPSAEQTPSTNDPTGLQEEPPDQSRIPPSILELGRMLGRMNIRELGARLYSVVAGESGEPSEEPIADPTEEAQPESAEADDGGIPEATGADDESGPTLARAQRQLQELEDELVELEERIETLNQWRQESAPEELSGIEDVITRQEELKQRLDSAATRLQGLEPDPEPADQDAADEAGEPSPAQAVAELEDIRDALGAQDGRVSDLEDQRVTLELRSIAREVVEEIAKRRRVCRRCRRSTLKKRGEERSLSNKKGVNWSARRNGSFFWERPWTTPRRASGHCRRKACGWWGKKFAGRNC